MKTHTPLALGVLAALATLALATAGVAMAHQSTQQLSGKSGAAPFNATFDAATGTIGNVVLTRGNESIVLAQSVAIAGSGYALKEGRARALVDGAGNVLALEGAGVMARSANGTTIAIVLPEGATVTPHEAVESWSPAGATVTYASGQKANLVLRNATLLVDGQSLTVTLAAGGHAAFHLVPAEGEGPGPAFGHGFGHGFGPGPMGGRGGPREGMPPMGGHGPRGGPR